MAVCAKGTYIRTHDINAKPHIFSLAAMLFSSDTSGMTTSDTCVEHISQTNAELLVPLPAYRYIGTRADVEGCNIIQQSLVIGRLDVDVVYCLHLNRDIYLRLSL